MTCCVESEFVEKYLTVNKLKISRSCLWWRGAEKGQNTRSLIL